MILTLKHCRVACRPTFSPPVSAPRASRRFCVVAMSTAESGGGGSQQRRVILWMRNDLRLDDNYCVSEAMKMVKSKKVDEVLPVYVFDPRFFKKSEWGTLKTGSFRAQFLLESVKDLKGRLQAVGSDLLVTVGRPEQILAGLTSDCKPGTVVLTQHECTSEEERVDAKVSDMLSSKGGKLESKWGMTMFHLEDLTNPNGPFPESRGGMKNMPDGFTPFKEKLERQCNVRACAPAPKAGDLPLPAASKVAGQLTADAASTPVPLNAERMKWMPGWTDLPWPEAAPAPPVKHPKSALDFKGGETAALARLKYYLWDTDLLATYFDTRNGMLGGDYSTKFAPWLAVGCLSPRRVYHEIKKYEDQRKSNKSTYWVIFELIWRDFYRFFALKHGNKIFLEDGISGQSRQWSADPNLIRRWANGTTGMPLVDANMRELAATGFMSNRGRQNVASYLVLDLGVDWRKGADIFESLLLDYDVASNWGNWVAAAGLTGGRVNKFNITKQAKDYDISGDYVRTWIPELAKVPPALIYEPWTMGKADQAKYGVEIGVNYPPPPSTRAPRQDYGDRSGSGPYPSGGRGGDRPMSGRGGARGGGGGSDRKKMSGRKQSDFERFG
uniref:Cryptochrome DASH n=1 Tax=Chlamydomonas sp. ICE-L TaxID=309537 RepID=A0A5B8NHV3_9CHLO|nr:cryptochrome DASH [Chlamydomonas sp. ICE-L]